MMDDSGVSEFISSMLIVFLVIAAAIIPQGSTFYFMTTVNSSVYDTQTRR
ncbi:hypothetical protein L0665_05215 [Methanogenium marinum]|uniref:Uncharacterized protein n=1 Tax=Methanogenium marinum TaxID=348610 RepID=A0A9Q4PYI2_9EURY|nr:hypothetical protein [Methanogenium marinum]MDE4908007.1 hypothetical protein [Methanogenium marinum]